MRRENESFVRRLDSSSTPRRIQMAQNYGYLPNGSNPTPGPGHVEGLKINRDHSPTPGTPEKHKGTPGPGHDENKTPNKDWAKSTQAGQGTFSNPSRNV